jgi:enoyl-CoA hydratase/carnithine racemase
LVKVGFPAGAVFERRPGDRDADNHRLQGARAPLFGDTIDARAALELGIVNALCKLGKASLRRAKRLPLISAEALNAAKRAINCGPDAAGLRTALYAGLDVVGLLYAT